MHSPSVIPQSGQKVDQRGVLETFKMEIVFFLSFVGICIFILLIATRSSRFKKDPALKRRNSLKSGTGKLETPADSVLSHRDELWQKRTHDTSMDVVRTNRFVPKSEASFEPEYDGYSRRDRHHLTPKPTHIKEEDHVDTVVTPGFGGKQGEHFAGT